MLQRVRAANMLATSGAEWAAVVDMHQSGTCNNQYPVVDLKRFRPKQVPSAVRASVPAARRSWQHRPLHNYWGCCKCHDTMS